MAKKLTEKAPIERVQASPESGLSAQAVEERGKKDYDNTSTDPHKNTP